MRERRRYPRADVAIAIRSADAASGREVRTVNLSGAGFAYDSSRWVEPFTRLEIVFVFPPLSGGGPDVERMLRADAVVMRTDPEDPDDSVDVYRVACAFTSMQDDDQDFVADYVDRVLAGAKAGA